MEPSEEAIETQIPPDAVEHHPARYEWGTRFEEVRAIEKKEGGVVYSATGEGAYWLVIDEGTLADFLPADEQDDLIRLMRYDDREKWLDAINAFEKRAADRRRDRGW